MDDHEITEHLAKMYTRLCGFMTKPEQEALLLTLVYLRQRIKRREARVK